MPEGWYAVYQAHGQLICQAFAVLGLGHNRRMYIALSLEPSVLAVLSSRWFTKTVAQRYVERR